MAYLVDYPFNCAEQVASRILGLAALREVLSAFSAAGLPSDDALIASMQRDVERLDRYFRVRENVEPDFVGRAWLGDDYLGSMELRGARAMLTPSTSPFSIMRRM